MRESRLAGSARHTTIPFFYEPRVDAHIEPLEIERAEPFIYGDHLWEAISEFPEFQNVERFWGESPSDSSSSRAASSPE